MAADSKVENQRWMKSLFVLLFLLQCLDHSAFLGIVRFYNFCQSKGYAIAYSSRFNFYFPDSSVYCLFNYRLTSCLHFCEMLVMSVSHFPIRLLSFFFFSNLWNRIDIRHCVSLRCIACWFDILIYCKIVTTIAFPNTSSTSHKYISFLWWEHLRSTHWATFKYIIQYYDYNYHAVL